MLKTLTLKATTLLMHAYWRWSRGLTLGVQCCLIDADGKIMLVRHGYRPGWHFPGGGVEKGETVLEALKRELAEEVGVTVEQSPEHFATYANFKHFRGDHILVYVCRHWSQPKIPRPNFEIADMQRFAPTDLPKDIHPPTQARILEIVEQQTPAMHWHVV